MNEVRILRCEIAAQRAQLREILARRASGEPRHRVESAENSDAYINYMMYCLHQERLRLRAHLERLLAAASVSEEDRLTLERAADALRAIEEVADPRSSADRLAELLLARVLPAAEALDTLAERRYAVEDWRRAAHVDADSIVEERRLRQRVLEHAGHAAGK